MLYPGRWLLGVARFINASMHRYTAILFPRYVLLYYFLESQFCIIIIIIVQQFSFRQKRYVHNNIYVCGFCKVIPQIHKRYYIIYNMKCFFYLIDWLLFIMNDIVLKHNNWSISGILSLGFFDFSLIIY